MAKFKSRLVKTPVFVVSHPHLVEPWEFEQEPGEEPKLPEYNCIAIFGPDQDLSELKKLAGEARDSMFRVKPRGLRSPFRKNEEKWTEDEATGRMIPSAGYVAGGTFITLKGGNKEKPDCRDHNMVPIVSASVLYAGCKCVAVVRAFPYDKRGNKGVTFGLCTLQKVGNGPNIAGRVNAADWFDKVELEGDEIGVAPEEPTDEGEVDF